MAKQILFQFEKGGSFVVELLEDKAPETCRVIWEALEQPWSEKFIHTGMCGWMVETPYFPVPEDYVLPNENLIFAPQAGDVAVVAPAEWRENSIKGYLPLFIAHNGGCSPLTHLLGIELSEEPDNGENFNWLFHKNMWETCRANVFGRVIEHDMYYMNQLCGRIRWHGIEGFTVSRYAE